ncbi:hypothetical protein KHO61_gp084 [Mycobacterium phage Mangeria]|uniref:Uncharacterized protein n=1 Tax=Mycobacterium phage Mangeria TaxID=2686471 RepID=A0A6B9LW74_9CAUD|nr:hypothetical protein KHO61_gp084 [Mycobacterium phage Mangeria]QHB47795.1 hypothetical protein SEA_MANGERIA_267 [Mycobacterium phage Mangeria]
MMALVALVLSLPPIDPGLPTPPPPLPTYIVEDDGIRMQCGPNFRWCWDESPRS